MLIDTTTKTEERISKLKVEHEVQITKISKSTQESKKTLLKSLSTRFKDSTEKQVL